MDPTSEIKSDLDGIQSKLPSRLRGSKIILFLILILAIPITLFLIKTAQDFRQRASESIPLPSPVFRLNAPNISDHFYTISQEQRDQAEAIGYTYEGIAFYAYPTANPGQVSPAPTDTPAAPTPTDTPVPTVSTQSGDSGPGSVFSSFQNQVPSPSPNESGPSGGFSSWASKVPSPSPAEGFVRGVSTANADAGPTSSVTPPPVSPNETNPTVTSTNLNLPLVPVYRLYSPSLGDHFYTLSKAESDNAAANDGYNFEGIAFYVFANPTDVPNLMPVYRLFNPTVEDHFYTISQTERDSAETIGYNYEGIAFYAFPMADPNQLPAATGVPPIQNQSSSSAEPRTPVDVFKSFINQVPSPSPNESSPSSTFTDWITQVPSPSPNETSPNNVFVASSGTPGTSCPLHSQGDANCDGKINTDDFNIWRDEYLSIVNQSGAPSTIRSDFNNSSPAVDTDDFNIWRDGFLNSSLPH